MNPLSHIRVLDLTHMLSGPYATMMLADMGADVIKIEPPGTGEGTRLLLADHPVYSLHGMGVYYMTLNRNKKSMTLDLKSAEGLKVFYELVAVSDVVLYNFSTGVPERLKIDHDHLKHINPKIITCSITGFGETGPDKDRVAFDIVAQAVGGIMSITGFPEHPPLRSGLPTGDLGSGLMAVIGVLGALVARQHTGYGQHVDISMLDSQISMLNFIAAMYFMSGESPQRDGNGHFAHVPYDAYQCSDGYIIIAVITDNFWLNLMGVLNAPDLDTDENKTMPGRRKNRELITRRLNEIFLTNTQTYWSDVLRKARVPSAPVNTVEQAVADPQIIARQMIAKIHNPLGGSIYAPGNPIKLSDAQNQQYAPPPLLGEHTQVVLQDLLKKTQDEIDLLRQSNVI